MGDRLVAGPKVSHTSWLPILPPTCGRAATVSHMKVSVQLEDRIILVPSYNLVFDIKVSHTSWLPGLERRPAPHISGEHRYEKFSSACAQNHWAFLVCNEVRFLLPGCLY